MGEPRPRPRPRPRTRGAPHAPLTRSAAERLRAAARRGSLAAGGAALEAVSRGLARLPAQRRYALADRVTGGLSPLWAPARRAARLNFERAVGSDPAFPPPDVLAESSLRNYGRMAMDFLVARTAPAEVLLAQVETQGEEYALEAIEGGQGAVLALPHVGSWDMAALFAAAYGFPITVVTEGDWATELVAGSRERPGVRLAPRGIALRELFRALRRNEAVVLLSDIVRPGVQVVEVPFFNSPAPFPVGPARLAWRTGAPVLVVACVRLAPARFRLVVGPPLRPDGAPDEASACRDLTARIASGFEAVIRTHPDQWYPFHPVWPDLASARP